MSRKRRKNKKEIVADPKYKDNIVSKFINVLMLDGKKSVAEKIFYSILSKISNEKKQDALKLFHDVINNVKPRVEVRSRRVGGATYQVPLEVRPSRRQALAMRWLVNSARARSEKTMTLKLANELLDASEGKGEAIKKKEDTHRMAEANRAFSHFRF